jgi:hypothetical protein
MGLRVTDLNSCYRSQRSAINITHYYINITLLRPHILTKNILSGKNILIDKGSSGERSKVPMRTASIGEGSQAS